MKVNIKYGDTMIILWTVDMAYLKGHAIKYVIYCDKVHAHSILYLLFYG